MKGKIKVMKTRPEVTDQEIKSYMDFDALLKKQQSLHQGHQHVRLKVLIGSTVFLTLTVIGFLFVWPPNGKITAEKEHRPGKSAVPPTAEQTIDTLTGKRPIEENAIDVEKAQGPGPAAKTTPGDVKTEIRKGGKKNEERAIESVYTQAEPRDGYPVLYAYFEENLLYPHDAIKDSVEGVMNVVFSIDAHGKAGNIAIENSLGPLFDQEAIRLLNNMPLWRPASYNGKVVPSKISLPITFDLSKATNNK
jgi:TonB family protein